MAAIVITALSVTVLGLGAPSEVWAAPDQVWQFKVDPTFTLSDGSKVIVKVTAPALTVSGTTGAFLPLSVPVPRPVPTPAVCLPFGDPVGNVTLSGTLSATTLRLTGLGTVCGIPVSFSGTATLDKPFPTATSATDGTLQGLSVTGTFSASCVSGCSTVPSSQQQVAQATAGAQAAATLGTVALMSTGVQTTNIGLRLAALRGGVTGVSMSGLSLNIDGKSLPLGAVTSLLPSLERSGGASADSSSMFSRLGIFAVGQGSFGNQDATSREPGFDFHTVGITVGGDYRLTDQLILGGAFGYLRTKSELDSSAGDSTTNGYNLSAYGTYYILKRLYVDGIATFGWNTYNLERNIADANATAKSDTDGTQFSISVSTGYNLNVGAFTFGPTGRVNYVRVHIDSFQERGAEPFNLSVANQTIESVTTALGGQATYAISMQWGVLTPLARFEWEHEYKGGSRAVSANVVADPTTTVTAQTNNPDRDYFNLGAGLSATFKGGVSAFVQYDTVLGRNNFTNHAFNAGVRFEF